MSLRSRTIAIIVFVLAASFALCALAMTHRTTYSETRDPSGRYMARISYHSWRSLVPMAPGSSGDKPCFVEIFDVSNQGARRSMGRLPVPMLQLAALEWTTDGAEIPLIGAWDFECGEY
jgi:hypothetical protein